MRIIGAGLESHLAKNQYFSVTRFSGWAATKSIHNSMGTSWKGQENSGRKIEEGANRGYRLAAGGICLSEENHQ